MAYNRHFIFKRKNANFSQTNTSAKVATNQEIINNVNNIIPGKLIIQEARKTGELDLDNFGLYEIPNEIYFINANNKDRNELKSFDDDDNISWWEDILLYKLILSSNKLKLISDKIKYLNNLVHLDLTNNQLIELPKEIEDLILLQYLNVSKNNLTYLPENIGNLCKLKQLYIRDNKIKEFPSDFCRLIDLEYLDISGNGIIHVPVAIEKFICLKYLNVSNNKLMDLPKTLGLLKDLTHFNASNNRIIEIPDTFEAEFEILDYSVNMLNIFPINKYLPSLQVLNVSSNAISVLSQQSISYIPNINKLLLSKNKLDDIPKEVSELKCLIHLDISFNALNAIPYSLGSMPSLNHLHIEGNPFRSISMTIMKKGTEALKKYLRNRNTIETKVDEDDINVEVINDDSDNSLEQTSLLFDAHDVNSYGLINLNKRNLTAIPSEFFQSLKNKKIQSIIFSNNKLCVFPIGLTAFGQCITRIDISSNRITELPDIFGSFKRIEYLNISNNILRNLPTSFYLMKNTLSYLDISHNPFGLQLPDCIFEITSLRLLSASHCSLVHIDADKFLKLPQLNGLDLSHNQIEILEPKFGLCTQIKCLNLENNKIRTPTQSIIEYGTEAVLQYLRTLIES